MLWVRAVAIPHFPRGKTESVPVAEVEVAPFFGDVHVDYALRGPDPVVFFGLACLPLDAAEVDAPLVSCVRRGDGEAGCVGLPGEGYFYCPAVVFVGGFVEGALDGNGGFEAGDVPAVVGFAAEAVGLVEEEIPAGVECVDFEFEVAGVVFACCFDGGLEEDFEVVVVEDY